MTARSFLIVHTTLTWLIMWQHNQLYHATSIRNVQWHIICLCRLYNAVRQIGGLKLDWPDLEFIINVRGEQRIFAGDRTVACENFLDRLYDARGLSAQDIPAEDGPRSSSRPRATKAVYNKCGLAPYLPLEREIRDYYHSSEKKYRRKKRDAIFNYLNKLSISRGMDLEETHEAAMKLANLQHNFAMMATMITSEQPKKKCKNKPRVRSPNFEQQDNTCPRLLKTMGTELKSMELHSHFDYLSFYRRTSTLFL